MIKLKRAYEPASRGDGYRVLVERLWPRGIRKQDLAIDEWLKDVAPFKQRYHRELMQSPAHERLLELAHRAAKQTVMLIFSSHDTEHNNAVVLKEELDERVQRMAARAEHHPTGA